MAITRRQFVTRMGALAAAVGFSQADVSRITEAFAGNSHDLGGTLGKPRVIWVHGAECTGCSTSLLSLLEAPGGQPLYGAYQTGAAAALGLPSSAVTTGAALGLAGVTASTHLAGYPESPFTLWTDGASPVNAIEGSALVNIADVVIDVIDLQYHETVMSMGGDLGAQWLHDFVQNGETATPFVLVVEGALQDRTKGGAWDDTSSDLPWCSIGCSDDFDAATHAGFENDMAETVVALSVMGNCKGIIPIGQCACYGGYPGCKPPITSAEAFNGAGGFDPSQSQTGAMGVKAYLGKDAANTAALAARAKVINVPGCPTNPWWFVLTVVLFMADFVNNGALGILAPDTHAPMASALDMGGRLKAVYPLTVHSAWCPRYEYYVEGTYAYKPGDPGCLQKLGCKGIATSSLCGAHGWNNQQPQNGSLSNADLNNGGGGHCTRAGHPCMACTEQGYPDSFVPFVNLNA